MSLSAARLLDIPFTGNAPVKAPHEYRIVGKYVPRGDIPSKVRGTYTYVQHLRLPGMLHARIVRPRGQRAYAAGAKLHQIDAKSIADIPGARVVRKGDFVGVVAENEWDAIRAARRLKVEWIADRSLPESGKLYERMRAEKTDDHVVKETGDATKAFEAAAHVASIACDAPYQSHASFAPNCALADVTGELCTCDLLDPGHLRPAQGPRSRAGSAGRENPGPVLRFLRDLRP